MGGGLFLYKADQRVGKPKERARLLYDLARALEDKVDEFSELETRDSGKPLSSSRADMLSTSRYLEFYAGAADKFYGETIWRVLCPRLA